MEHVYIAIACSSCGDFIDRGTALIKSLLSKVTLLKLKIYLYCTTGAWPYQETIYFPIYIHTNTAVLNVNINLGNFHLTWRGLGLWFLGGGQFFRSAILMEKKFLYNVADKNAAVPRDEKRYCDSEKNHSPLTGFVIFNEF